MQVQALAISRRRFFTRTVVAVGIASITALGFGRLPDEAKTAPSLSTVDAIIAAEYGILDAHYAQSGRSRIVRRLLNGTEEKKGIALSWIGDRAHSSLYDLVCDSLQDGFIQVRLTALRVLQAIDPVVLKPLQGRIERALGSAKHAEFRSRIEQLLLTVRAS